MMDLLEGFSHKKANGLNDNLGETPPGLPFPMEFGGSNNAVTLLQSSRKGRSRDVSPSVFVVAVISLAFAYWLLRCFRHLPSGATTGVSSRALAGADGRECSFSEEAYPHEEEGEWNNYGFEGYDSWQPVAGAGGGNIWGATVQEPGDPLAGLANPFLVPQEGAQNAFLAEDGAGAGAWAGTSGQPQRSSRGDPHSSAGGEGQQETVSGTPEADSPEDEEDLKDWEGRNISESAQAQTKNLLNWMRQNAEICISVLPSLPPSQALRLANLVLKIIALDLGGLSLLPDNLEPMRNQTGEVLLDLVSTALSLDSEGEALPGQRMHAINLERLIRLIKAPRPRTEMVSTRKRKNRMVTLLSAVRIVGKYCTNSLLNILHHKNHSSKEMLVRVVEEEIRVLTALWHEHQQHLIRDRLHRHFTLACQRRAGVWLLIPAEDVKKGLEPLPEYKQLLQRLDDAVASVGGTVLTRVFRETKDDDEEHGEAGLGDGARAKHSTGPTDGGGKSMPGHKREEASTSYWHNSHSQKPAMPFASERTSGTLVGGQRRGEEASTPQHPNRPPFQQAAKPFPSLMPPTPFVHSSSPKFQGGQQQGSSGPSWRPSHSGFPRPQGGQQQGSPGPSWHPSHSGFPRPQGDQQQGFPGPRRRSSYSDFPRSQGGQQQGFPRHSWHPSHSGFPRPQGDQQQGFPGPRRRSSYSDFPRPQGGQQQGFPGPSWHPSHLGFPRPQGGQQQGSPGPSWHPPSRPMAPQVGPRFHKPSTPSSSSTGNVFPKAQGGPNMFPGRLPSQPRSLDANWSPARGGRTSIRLPLRSPSVSSSTRYTASPGPPHSQSRMRRDSLRTPVAASGPESHYSLFQDGLGVPPWRMTSEGLTDDDWLAQQSWGDSDLPEEDRESGS